MMKALWITHTPLGKAGELIEGDSSQSGNWVDAAAKQLLDEAGDIHIAIATISSQSRKVCRDGITYYGISGIKRKMGFLPRQKERYVWKRVITDFSPDIILVWGTEYSIGISVLDAAGSIPVLFYIQGVVGAIAKYKYGRIPKRKLIWTTGAECPKLLFSAKNQIQMSRQAIIEIEMIRRSAGIIVDNKWAESYYRQYIPELKVYHHNLPINEAFIHDSYNQGNSELFIFTIAGSGPHKGLHILIEALAIVKERYKSIRVVIPGNMSYRNPAFIFRPPYITYLNKIIKAYHLEDNVQFCGRLTPEQMCDKVRNCAVFVMPSCIENHSSSLREAMLVGAPCIASSVGSVAEFLKNRENGLVYRYEEPYALANAIIELLNNRDFARELGKNATEILNHFPMQGNGKQLEVIFKGAKGK